MVKDLDALEDRGSRFISGPERTVRSGVSVPRENLLDICPFVPISKAYLQRMRFFCLFVHERDVIPLAIWQRSISRRLLASKQTVEKF
jgi:hypothetical protein